MDIIEDLRNNLKGQGNANVISLRISDNFFYEKYIHECIDDLEKSIIKYNKFGTELNNLEKLAITILLDTANIPTDYFKKEI